MVRPFGIAEGGMSLFGQTVMTPGPEGQRPVAPVPSRPPTPWYRRPAVVVLVALAVALVLNLVEVKLLAPDPVPTQPTRPPVLIDDSPPSPRPEDIELNRL